MARLPSRITLDDLPLFATDDELAIAVVGPHRAPDWVSSMLPTLEHQPGFPAYDPAHGGRYTPAVRRFYDAHHGLTGARPAASDKPEEPSAWKKNPLRRAG